MPRGVKARQLADELRRGIAELRWPDGRLPTEQQLAAEQGVSVNTVRRAVDLLVADGLVYRRQGSGTYVEQSGVAGTSSTGPVIGVCMPSMTYYFPRLIAAIEQEIAASGGQMLLSSSDYDLAREREVVDRMLATGVQGIVIAPELPPGGARAALSRLQALPVPIVTVERWLGTEDDEHELVCTNRIAGGYAAARHLLEFGHTGIAFLSRSSPHLDQVARGMRGALAEAGHEMVQVDAPRRWTPADASDLVTKLLERKVTAAVCVADREAALLVTAAHQRGLRVPDDLSLISYDDEVADLAEVPLTALSPAKAEVGRLAVRTLMRRLREPEAPVVQQFVLPELKVRESTGPVRR
ncbi:hypothetical protein UK23_08465 [Lentzea aerocolonigenes]|uniref:HTH gntR-type domain-containing protein n=1 Tax=Lentzea aerocolonigenes TaxID=68170 RepID=A0A0F0H5S0_LENAE|nr:hypothetical protein UK23_08465 [Lentzea aerocolonigenes]